MIKLKGLLKEGSDFTFDWKARTVDGDINALRKLSHTILWHGKSSMTSAGVLEFDRSAMEFLITIPEFATDSDIKKFERELKSKFPKLTAEYNEEHDDDDDEELVRTFYIGGK